MNYFDKFENTYVIAELSSNHANRIDIVLKSIEAAAKSGANAIKTQLFKADSLTIPSREHAPYIDDINSPWNGENLYDLYKEASLPYEWYPKMMKCAEINSIDLFASVFDISSVDFALSLKMPILKVSSFELIHSPLIKYIKEKNIPLICSTGMANIDEIDNCLEILGSKKNTNLCLLKCTSDYPCTLDSVNLGQMVALRNRYRLPVGLSDHSLSNLPSIIATSLGARVIEKHFILDKNLKTPDAFFSIDADELTNLVKVIRSTEKMLENKDLNLIRQDVESHSLWERPSIYFSKNLNAGHKILENDLIIRRPSFGVEPQQYFALIGKEIQIDVHKYQPVKMSLFKINE